MKGYTKRLIQVALSLILSALFVYIFRNPLYGLYRQIEGIYRPCYNPITYSIGKFDPRFGITKKDFLNAIDQAAQIWEEPIHRKLFRNADHGSLTMNLLYDSRQQATVNLQKLGIVLHDDQDTYNTLKVKYDSLQSSYNQQKADLETKISAYQARLGDYQAKVAYWNSRGGAPQEEYDKLEQERIDLSAQENQISQAQDSLNNLVDTINSTATVLNRLVYELNLNANTYNYIGLQRGSEFQEGEYQSDITGKEINIYQFDDKAKLIRVLAHELGHAIGLEHLNNPKAIMYKLNQGNNDKLTPDDIAALKTVCGIK